MQRSPRIAALFAHRWPENCDRPCTQGNRAQCSCYQWAVSAEQHANPKRYTPSLYVACEFSAVAIATLALPLLTIIAVHVCALCLGSPQ